MGPDAVGTNTSQNFEDDGNDPSFRSDCSSSSDERTDKLLPASKLDDAKPNMEKLILPAMHKEVARNRRTKKIVEFGKTSAIS